MIDRFPLLLGADVFDERQRREVLGELFDYRPYLMASAAMTLVIIHVFLSGARQEAVFCGLLVALGTIMRVAVARSYQGKYGIDDVGRCAKAFAIMCVVVALLWGVTGAVLYRVADDSMRIAVLGIGCVLVQAVTLRTNMAPGPTMAQVAILIAFHAAAIVYDGLYVLIPVCILYTLFQGMCILALGRVRVRQMRAERETLRLLDELQCANTELTRANLRLADSALSDPLTGVGNRRRFEEALATMAPAAVRSGRPLSLLLIDVDHFKRFNDEHGHVTGDEALRRVADRLRAIADGPNHVVARFGGEEFAVLLAGADEAAARVVADQILTAIGDPAAVRPLTVSIGVATARGPAGTMDIVSDADRALYAAKRAGRNRVVSNSELVDQQDTDRLKA
ncbi:MAG: GGDEF domain-containing protein [Phreatobacter sp.]|uniref:GGDEF domain-containing protein n=1 Tax=Phreatobacter sp. TaxID=1966341 RepID=UPI0027349ADB|nr:GGDEF domain-containing protein [Phreatobacter sp.]MDP2803200.1 GGDEF domain-containing protein [Phreatobacter sp.]